MLFGSGPPLKTADESILTGNESQCHWPLVFSQVFAFVECEEEGTVSHQGEAGDGTNSFVVACKKEEKLQ